MILAHKIVLNPTRSQECLLWEHVGYARFAANRAIEDFREVDVMVNGGVGEVGKRFRWSGRGQARR